MPETLCRKCGCELVSISECELCGMTKGVACPGCGNVADDKVHIDCLTAQSLVVS
jgi:hypothetical protein